MPTSNIISRIAHEVYEHQPSTMPDGRWWEFLQTNFCQRPEGFELEFRDQLRVKTTAALDVALRTAAASVVGLTAVPMAFNPATFRRSVRDAPVYSRLLEEGRGREFYPHVRPHPPVRERDASWPRFLPSDGGRCVDLSFESPFTPYNSAIARRYQSHRRNRFGRARYWRHDGDARPTIVLIHGFVADTYILNEWWFQVRWLYEKLGLDVVVFTLPFHGARAGNGSVFSGHHFFSGGANWVNEAFRQAVVDFRVVLDYLEHQRAAPAVGVSGISLGGYTTALLASVEPRLAFAIPNVPVVSLPDAVLEWDPIGTVARALLTWTPLSIRQLRHMTALHCALSYEPVLPKERLMIIGGVGDRLAPPKHSRLLWDHWGRPLVHWFPGSHLLHLDQGEYLRHIAKFLGGIGFLPDRGPRRQAVEGAQLLN